MDRKKFIILSLAGTAAAAFPSLQCSTGNEIEQPKFLESLVGEAKVKELGKLYVERFAAEADSKKLSSLISATFSGQSDPEVTLKDEFSNGKIVILNGWILSLTEARQSALLYLNS